MPDASLQMRNANATHGRLGPTHLPWRSMKRGQILDLALLNPLMV